MPVTPVIPYLIYRITRLKVMPNLMSNNCFILIQGFTG